MEFTSNNIGGEIADDKWVSKWLQLTPTALGEKSSYVIDFKSNGYLPNDNFKGDYEVLISCWIWSNGNDGNNGSLWLYNSGTTSGFCVSLCYTRNRTKASSIQGTNCIFPLLNGDRRICFYNSTNALSSWGIQLSGYRKLGTNT